jgi:hypothetical protein
VWRRVYSGILLAALGAILIVGNGSANALSTRAFYLAVHPRQCLVVPTQGAGKTVLVVPCSDAAHNQEVYAIGHGGWGHRAPPSHGSVYVIARSVCLSAFQRLTGRQMAATEGWWASWPDPGAETAKYGDKIICKLRAWPHMRALGSGWHVR